MNLLYYENAYLKECKSKILDAFESDEKYFIRLDNNIFYPQGGGQKGDKGVILVNNETYQVINCVKDDEKNPLIILDKNCPKDNIGKTVLCSLNWEYRYFQMKMHTSLHLLHYLLEKYYAKAIDYPISSNIEDDFAYNKYPMELINDEVINYLNIEMNKLTISKSEVITYPDKDNSHYRYWKCLDYIIPCGGVHVSCLNEIGKIMVESHTKKGITTVKILLN
jgi:alanyl-tRNA synthetase